VFYVESICSRFDLRDALEGNVKSDFSVEDDSVRLEKRLLYSGAFANVHLAFCFLSH